MDDLSRFSANRAVGLGANPAQSGTPGGGSGGAIYNDGDRMTLSIVHTAGLPGIFFLGAGRPRIAGSVLR